MRCLTLLTAAMLCFHASAVACGQTPPEKLPTVVLLGDSIRLSYAPIVAKQLAGKAKIISHAKNGGDSANTLNHLDEWAIEPQPDVVHFNCGIHDTKKSKTKGTFQVPPAEYEANLRKIVERLRKETKAKLIFALTTPLVDDRAAKLRVDKDYELLNASTEQYNEIARRVMQELDVPVNDLRAALGDATEQARLIVEDGVHVKPEGSQKLGVAVAEIISRYLPAAVPADAEK